MAPWRSFSPSVSCPFAALPGLAVDASRAFSVSQRISGILDAAALAGAKLLDDSNATDQDDSRRCEGLLPGTLRATRFLQGSSSTNFTPSVDRTSRTKVTVDIDVSLPTSFAQVVGVSQFAFPSPVAGRARHAEDRACAGARYHRLDERCNGKLPALKAAASDLIDNLMSGSATEDSIRIAVAPFSASVNAGALAATGSARHLRSRPADSRGISAMRARRRREPMSTLASSNAPTAVPSPTMPRSAPISCQRCRPCLTRTTVARRPPSFRCSARASPHRSSRPSTATRRSARRPGTSARHGAGTSCRRSGRAFCRRPARRPPTPTAPRIEVRDLPDRWHIQHVIQVGSFDRRDDDAERVILRSSSPCART